MTTANTVEEAIRKSHCSHDDRDNPDHRCVGTCTITPDGVELECAICGADATPHTRLDKQVSDRARQILHAAGLSYDDLSTKAQVRVEDVLKKHLCPGCGSEKPAQNRGYYPCHCGEWRWDDGFQRARWSRVDKDGHG